MKVDQGANFIMSQSEKKKGGLKILIVHGVLESLSKNGKRKYNVNFLCLINTQNFG